MSLVLLSGPRHSGKTSVCRALATEVQTRGWSVAGVLEPAVFQADQCVGYDVVDLATGCTAPLARLGTTGPERQGGFTFLPGGLELGRRALAAAMTANPDLVIVDEVGPLELAGGGWATGLDTLAARHALTLFTVRPSLLQVLTDRWHVPTKRCLYVDTPDIVSVLLRQQFAR